ncbi:hypothetical protein ABB37_04138 [Leptomonas pyrrhocoris]|uniref:SET domain-containing protein n=1 Tax=Leptomonas pyrrhocoris TaxID=157538 RepID=A0A0N1J4Z0_LEPPY|nr:hypothetical protein ABB37_04138 [Leptomonas pyrrhocoris]KPA81894.1 hypothetical protein ABB37_04138 [Leptomonas pyrrhocoris]|eukprot:XP_015660333.1 hypothetical protein ABB37_04138 [Leptomonas pyrrhocoris]
MIYEVLSRVIGDMCVRLGVPLNVRSISLLLDGIFDEDVLDIACQRMMEEGKLVEYDRDWYTTRNMRFSCHVNLLVSREYQWLGMTLICTEKSSLVRYIPASAEHRFFEVKPSTVGPHAGFGLFLRSTRRIPQGCVLCEYRGRSLRAASNGAMRGIYVVRVRSSGTFIDGVTKTGEYLSLATFINDDGPLRANAQLMEYDAHPGRVFIVAIRDIAPSEEIFVLYGATYWGFSTYDELRVHVSESTPKAAGACTSQTMQAAKLLSQLFNCPKCGEKVPWQAVRLHAEACGDPLASQRLLHLNCLPRSELTSMCIAARITNNEGVRAWRKATSLVDLSNPQTFAHTYEDIVKDLEFSFADVDEDASHQ